MSYIKYKPLDYQRKFHFSEQPKVYLSGGYGCLPGFEEIETDKGLKKISQIKRGDKIFTMSGQNAISFVCSDSINMGKKDCFRISHDFGELYVSESHQIFLDDYRYELAVSCLGRQAFYLQSCFYNLPRTISEFFQSESFLCAESLTQRLLDLKDHYLAYYRRYDLQLQKALNNDLEQIPSQDGVLKSFPFCSSLSFERKGDHRVLPLEHNRLDLLLLHPSTHHFFPQLAHLEEALVNQTQALTAECISHLNQLWLRFLWNFVSHRNGCESTPLSFVSNPCSCLSTPVTRVNKVESIGQHETYDIHVPVFNCYFSKGLLSHNCGKTHSLVMKMFWLMNHNPGLSGGLLCPTIKMFKRDVLPTIQNICEENQIQYDFNKTDSTFYFPLTKSTIYVFHSEDDGHSIRGPNLAFGLINEVTICSKEAFDAFIARIRVKEAGLLQVAMSGTPEEFNWAYDYFIENPREDTELIFGNSRDNIYLHESYIQTLEQSYDSLMVQQYIDGKFVNLKGNRAAYAFDRFKHVSSQLKQDLTQPIYVSVDFNINPMAAVLWNRMDIKSKVKLQAFDEICLQASNTFDLAKVIKEKVGTEVVLFPDPAGRAGSTKSHFSDFDILRQAGFKDLRFKSQVSVRDSLNAMNALLSKNEVMISSKCINLIADLEQCKIKDGTFEIDKTNPKRTHWLDGFKNMCEYEFPIIKPTVVKVTKYA